MKLDTATAKKVHATEARSPQGLLDPGMYKAALFSVKKSARPQRNGAYAWEWQFKIVAGPGGDTKHEGARLTERTGLHDDQLWTLKLMFDAFEVKPNVDTDTLIGKEITLAVDQREIQEGSRKGKITNDITEVLPLSAYDGAGGDDDDWGDDEGGDGDDAEPDF